MKLSLRIAAVALGCSVAATALSGCTLSGNVPRDAAPPSSADAAWDQTERLASIRGSRLCIVNDSPMNVRVEWIGFSAPIDIERGTSACHGGYEHLLDDVDAAIEYEPVDTPGEWVKLYAFATNHFIGLPRAATYYEEGRRVFGVCGNFSEGYTRTFQTPTIHAELKRLSDTESYKEFILSLTASDGPSSAADVGRCLNPPAL